MKIFRILILPVVFISCLLTYFLPHIFSPELPSKKNPIIMYSNQAGDDLKNVLSIAINQSKNELIVLIYSLKDPKIIHLLKKKSEQNCSVTVICDGKASKGIHKLLGKKVKTIYRHHKGLMHLKVVISDRIRTWIGSTNFSCDSLKFQGNLLIGIRDRSFAKYHLEKVGSFRNIGLVKKIQSVTNSIGNQNIDFHYLPDSSAALREVKDQISSAQKSIKVAMYTFTNLDIANELILAQKRGIKVSVIIDGKSANGVSKKIATLLAKNNIPTYLYSGQSLLHHKFAWIDGDKLVCGSANWTQAAFTKNDDCFFILWPLKKAQQKTLYKTWKTATHLSFIKQ